MIDGKIIKFGYGDVAIWVDSDHCVAFQQTGEPHEIREHIAGDVELIGEAIYIKFTHMLDCNIFKLHLEGIRNGSDSRIFDFEGYTFDFTNYNEASVDMVERKLSRVIEVYSRLTDY